MRHKPGIEETAYVKQGGQFIDPLQCGSSVNWYVTVTVTPPYVDTKGKPRKAQVEMAASASLTDCNRSIAWALGPEYNDFDPCVRLEKLDIAIGQLQECRKALIIAGAKVEKLRKKYNLTGDDE